MKGGRWLRRPPGSRISRWFKAKSAPPISQIQPLPPNITSVQPGGGVCYRLELAWGRWRRWYLRTIRPAYVRHMAATRRGDTSGAPHEIIDPRDLKYCRNLCMAEWDAADDPFAWREKIPFARWGLAELQLMAYPLAAVTVLLAVFGWWPLALGPGVVLALVVYFFRDPPRRVPAEPGLMVSPADGKIVEIAPVESDPFVGGPAVRIGIFLSIFNVHLNRVPCDARVKLTLSARQVFERVAARECARTKACGLGWKSKARRVGGWWYGRSPARLPGGSFAVCVPARNLLGEKSSA